MEKAQTINMSDFEIDSNGILNYYRGNAKEVVIPDNVSVISPNAFQGRRKELISVEIPSSVKEIKEAAFKDCVNLTKVTIPSSVTKMGDGAFLNCTSLKTIVIYKIRILGRACFKGCSRLEQVVLPDSLTEIKAETFRDCLAIRKIKLPHNVSKIGPSSFHCCSNLEEIILPPCLKVIEDSAFLGCSKLKTIKLPKSLEEIQNSSFEGCEELKEINIPQKITDINPFTFKNCSSLTTITFSENLKSIGKDCFNGCSSLPEINIPDGVLYINENTFKNCSSLETVHFPSSLKEIRKYAFKKCEKLKDFIFPYSLTLIDLGAFSFCNNLVNVQLPDLVEKISFNSFAHCKNLLEVKIGSGLKEIINPFTSSPSIKNIINTSPYYEYKNGVLYNKETKKIIWISPNCIKLELPENSTTFYSIPYNENNKLLFITVPKTVVEEEKDALASFITSFSSYEKLLSVVVDKENPRYYSVNGVLYDREDKDFMFVPKGRTKVELRERDLNEDNMDNLIQRFKNGKIKGLSLGSSSKYTEIEGCIYNKDVTTLIMVPNIIEKLTIPRTVKKVRVDTFTNCTSLKEIYVEDGNTSFFIHKGCLYTKASRTLIFAPLNSIKEEMIIPKGVWHIARYALRFSKNITKRIFFPESLYEIQQDNFDNSVLEKVSFHENCPIEELRDDLFSNCTKLEKVKLPSNIKKIGKRCFNECKKLSDIYLPSSLKETGFRAFYGCENIKNLTLPPPLQDIGSSSFANMTKLESITLPPSIHYLDSCCFMDCIALNEVIFNDELEQIGNEAFANCKELKEINIPPHLTKLSPSAFKNCDRVEVVRVNEENPIFTVYSDRVVYNIEKHTIAYYPPFAPTVYKMPEKVKYITEGVFSSNERIKSIEIANSVKEIEPSSFSNCTNLRRVILPSIKILPRELFYKCSALEEVTIKEGCEELQKGCFSNCTNLINIVLPSTIKTIGVKCFEYCTNLEFINVPNDVTKINKLCFAFCNNLQKVVLGNSIIDIDSKAFISCDKLKSIYIPSSVLYIAPDAFDKGIVIKGEKDSFAEAYAKDNGFTFVKL